MFGRISTTSGEQAAVYIQPSDLPVGRQKSTWTTWRVTWDLDAGKCSLAVGDGPAVPLQIRNDAPNGISYLRLGSAATTKDEAGVLVELVKMQGRE